MKNRVRFTNPMFVCLLFVFWGGFNAPPSTNPSSLIQNQQVPRFEHAECRDLFPEFSWDEKKFLIFSWNGVDLKRFSCGYLVTHADYGTQAGGTIRLEVMVTRPKSDSVADPVIYLDGGPGSRGVVADPAQAMKISDYFGRDFIQFGQRGSASSLPALGCAQYSKAILENWEKPLDWRDRNEILIDTLQDDCFAEYARNDGFGRIDQYSSETSARDVITLIQSLGYQRANLYGISYGTLLAQHVLAMDPHIASSVVLDGVVPLGIDFNARFAVNLQRSLDEIFKACGMEDSKCQKAYPDLEPFFYQLVDQLNHAPARISVEDSGKRYSQVYLDGDSFVATLGDILYSRDELGEIPRIIYAAGNGRFTEIEKYYFLSERSRDFAWGMYFSVYCMEFERFNPDNYDLSRVKPELQYMNEASEQFINRVCPSYDHQNEANGNTRITQKVVPILIFSGHFDPVTPPQFGQMVADSLGIKPGFVFVSPTHAHGSSEFGNFTGDFSKCANGIIRNFFNDPVQKPDKDTCWEDIPKSIDFNTINLEIYAHRLVSWWQDTKQQMDETLNNWLENMNNWWDEQLENIDNWWDEQWKKLNEEISNWWEDMQRRLLEWIEQQLMEWLSQWCAGAFLPVGILATTGSAFRLIFIRQRSRQDG